MKKVLLFNLKLMRKNYLVILVTVVSFAMVLGMLFAVKTTDTHPPDIIQGTIGLYTGFPIPISFGGIKVYTSTAKMVEDIKNMILPLGVDVKHKVLYTSPIYASISTEALSYMASAAERLLKGEGLYPYHDDVWWDPYTLSVGKFARAFLLFFLFLMDFLIMYLSLAVKVRLYRTEKLWHLLGISKVTLHLSFVFIAFMSAFVITLPVFFFQPDVYKVYLAIVYITLVSAGISAYFLRYASNMLMAYLAILPPIALLFGAGTYVLLPDKLGLFKYVPWTYTFIDILKYAGAEGMIGGITPALKWGVLVVWGAIAILGWYKGVIENA
ncbi:hypothetical protein GM182_00980 [bacterium 3DAC]|nr:hypothetical protein GM182_00980 [bacterium 3DAC]